MSLFVYVCVYVCVNEHEHIIDVWKKEQQQHAKHTSNPPTMHHTDRHSHLPPHQHIQHSTTTTTTTTTHTLLLPVSLSQQ